MTHQRTVAVGERVKAGRGLPAFEQLVQRAAAPQHAVEDVGSNTPCRQAGRLRLNGRLAHAVRNRARAAASILEVLPPRPAAGAAPRSGWLRRGLTFVPALAH